jgi:hypothetical protein
MIKNNKYLLAIAFLVFTFNYKVNAQKKLERMDSCYKISNEMGLQKFPAYNFRFEINRWKYTLQFCSVLVETEEEFRSFMSKNRSTVVDSLVNIINFNKNAIVLFLLQTVGCNPPTANVVIYKNNIIIEGTAHGPCTLNWVLSFYSIIDKKQYSTLSKTYICGKHEK